MSALRVVSLPATTMSTRNISSSSVVSTSSPTSTLGAAEVVARERAVVERLRERGDQVVGRAGIGPARLDELGAHGGVLAERLGRGVEHRVVRVVVPVARHHGVAPLVEPVALIGVEAHQLGDHDQRHVDGEVLDEVEAPAVGDLVDDLVRQLADVVGDGAHPRRA